MQIKQECKNTNRASNRAVISREEPKAEKNGDQTTVPERLYYLKEKEG